MNEYTPSKNELHFAPREDRPTPASLRVDDAEP